MTQGRVPVQDAPRLRRAAICESDLPLAASLRDAAAIPGSASGWTGAVALLLAAGQSRRFGDQDKRLA